MVSTAGTGVQMMNEQHELSFDELDAIAGGGFLHYLIETAHALVQGTGNSGNPTSTPTPTPTARPGT